MGRRAQSVRVGEGNLNKVVQVATGFFGASSRDNGGQDASTILRSIRRVAVCTSVSPLKHEW